MKYIRFFGPSSAYICRKLNLSDLICIIRNSVVELFILSIFKKVEAHFGPKLSLTGNFQISVAPLKLGLLIVHYANFH